MKNFYFICAFVSFLTILNAQDVGKPGCLERDEAVSLLETAEDLLKKANDAYPSCNKTECGGKLPMSFIQISKKLIGDVKENFPTCPVPEVDPEPDVEDDVEVPNDEKPRDCSDLLASGHRESKIYTVWPSETCRAGKELQVYCDMDTDYGGWTMIQRRGRYPNQLDFYQDWEAYKNGFGDISEEFWLGNENIRILCFTGCYIRFDLRSENGMEGYAVYKYFNLTRSSYTIHINDYSGNIGNNMFYFNNFPFSTKDKGNTEIAERDHSGWWSNPIYASNLNGIYKPGSNTFKNVYWFSWLKYQNLASVEIKVRPK